MDIAEFKRRAIEFGGRGIFKRSALNIRDGAGVFERVLSACGHCAILEIGTYRGVTAAYIATLCRRVITIDLLVGKMERQGETHDRVAFWQHMGVADKIELILVADNEEKRRVIADLDFDFAFVDGAHDETVALDFELVKRCGRVLFHDADDNRLSKPRVRSRARRSNCVYEFVRTLPPDHVEYMDIFALWRREPR